MKQMTVNLVLQLRRLAGDRRGAVAFLIAMSMTAILGFAALVVDLGNARLAKRTLQASTDAAALAGAAQINFVPGTAIATATSFSSVTGGSNATARMTATMTSGYPRLVCLASTHVSCTGADHANAIVVRQQATVPMVFARLVGFPSVTIAAKATAAANAGGQSNPADVMIVLDNTHSMANGVDSSCSYIKPTGTTYRIDCALAGARELISRFDPTVVNVGLMTFPGTTSAQAAKTGKCNGGSPTPVAYNNASLTYSIVGLGAYQTAMDTSGSPVAKSGLANSLRDSSGTCGGGLIATGGYGTFFADAITAAQASLAASTHTGAQKIIIILSDGDAGASASNLPVGKYANQCKQAVDAARLATGAGTKVYSIAYGAQISGGCSQDAVAITPCETMYQIASDAAKFYSDQNGVGGCTSTVNSISELVAIFASIVNQSSRPRLMTDNTT